MRIRLCGAPASAASAMASTVAVAIDFNGRPSIPMIRQRTDPGYFIVKRLPASAIAAQVTA